MDTPETLQEKRAKLSTKKLALLQKQLRGEVQSTAVSTIPRRSDTGPAPLSFLQGRLWFLFEWEPNRSTYNEAQVAWINGPLDLTAFEGAYRELARRHEILRTTYQVIDEQPVQVVAPSINWSLPIVDLSELAAPARETEAQRLAQEEANRPFDLERDFSWRIMLVRVEPAKHIALMTQHHISCDGWSLAVRHNEFVALYAAFAAGKPSPLPELPIQYADFACWQRARLQGAVLAELTAYWKKQLADLVVLQLPTDRPRPPVFTSRGATYRSRFSPALGEAIERLGRQEKTTSFVVTLAAFKALLCRYAGQTDIAIGSLVANRDLPELEGLIGFLAETLVLRTDLSHNPTFRELLQRVGQVTQGAYAHKDLPFDHLVAEIQGKRDPSRMPLVQVLFIWQEWQSLAQRPADAAHLQIDMSRERIATTTAKFDLTLTLEKNHESLACDWEYNTDLFDDQTITRLAGHFQALLVEALAAPDTRLADLTLLTSAERQQVVFEWNDTQVEYPRHRGVHELFESQVARTPQAIAVEFEDQCLSYSELNTRADCVAGALRQLGLGRGALVGMCVDRSLEMVIGLLGILKAGSAYVPLDPAYPPERLAFILQDSRVSVVLTLQPLAASLPQGAGQVICLDRDWAEIARQNEACPGGPTLPESPAYVIYTSGTTGQPKGVQIPQRAVVNFLTSMRHRPGLTEQDILLSVTTLAFDIAGLELFLPLTVGARVALVNREIAADGLRLAAHLADSGATCMQATPATWQLLRTVNWPGQPGLMSLCGGEACPPKLAAWLLDKCRAVWNLYGPTETTIWSCLYPVESRPGPIPIGRPIANTQVYLLDEQLNPVPPGVPGELHISGEGLACGYLNRPDLTAEKFIPHPFPTSVSSDQGTGGCRLYKTGDLARYRPEGGIEMLGRTDHQVKIHGFRIELGEIEAVLRQHPGVREAVALAREDSARGKRLVAYVVPNGEPGPATGELRRFLKEKLPDYMLPAAFVLLAALPLTPNGKVNRRGLPEPEGLRPELEVAYTAPQSELERTIAAIWQKVLKIDRVGLHDNFFELGGDSLMAMQVIVKAKQAGIQFVLQQLLEHQTIAELTPVARGVTGDADEQKRLVGRIPLTGPQKWFLESVGDYGGWWIMLFSFDISSSLGHSPKLVRQGVEHLLAYHDELRARFIRQETGWQQFIVEPDSPAPFTYVDLTEVETSEQARAILAISDALQLDMALLSTPLWRGALFQRGENQPPRLLLLVHHLIMDASSRGILAGDFQTVYQQLARGEPIRLPPETTSVKEYVEQIQAYVRSTEMRQELEGYWLTLPWSQLAALPVDDVTGRAPRAIGTWTGVETFLDAEETHLLQTVIPRVYKAQVSEALLMAVMQAVTQWTGRPHQLIGRTYTGRGGAIPGQGDLDLSRTVSWLGFDSYLLLEHVEARSPAESLQAIQEQCRRIPNQGLGWYLMRYYGEAEMVEKVRSLVRDDTVVMVNYMGNLIDPAADPFEVMQPVEAPLTIPWNPQSRDFHPPLFINVQIAEGRLKARWEYNRSEYRQATLERIAADFMEALRSLVSSASDQT